ncbi:unnamed protein product [Brachionus calyciflorus]|uniref:Uncharacterized protein n=1 Tax=Brachionus calyciflorus TaxID=104777 RepID=A0A814D4R2_9BILA|nr:unnamed protein product [Brachionus calyciflorus]
MKFSLCLILAIFGLACAIPELPMNQTVLENILNTTRCIYFSESKVFSCQGVGGEVECDAFTELSALGSRSFNFLGIGQLPNDYNFSRVESVRYSLYPRELDNTTYLNYSLPVNGGSVDLNLYFGESATETGIRVASLSCWARLVELLRATVLTDTVRVEDVESVLVGKVVIVDRKFQKKWLWGYGLGYYGLYNPWSFYGYGLYGK